MGPRLARRRDIPVNYYHKPRQFWLMSAALARSHAGAATFFLRGPSRHPVVFALAKGCLQAGYPLPDGLHAEIVAWVCLAIADSRRTACERKPS
jgi:hypothetical protein